VVFTEVRKELKRFAATFNDKNFCFEIAPLSENARLTSLVYMSVKVVFTHLRKGYMPVVAAVN
jgi:hypothetical protein